MPNVQYTGEKLESFIDSYGDASTKAKTLVEEIIQQTKIFHSVITKKLIAAEAHLDGAKLDEMQTDLNMACDAYVSDAVFMAFKAAERDRISPDSGAFPDDVKEPDFDALSASLRVQARLVSVAAHIAAHNGER